MRAECPHEQIYAKNITKRQFPHEQSCARHYQKTLSTWTNVCQILAATSKAIRNKSTHCLVWIFGGFIIQRETKDSRIKSSSIGRRKIRWRRRRRKRWIRKWHVFLNFFQLPSHASPASPPHPSPPLFILILLLLLLALTLLHLLLLSYASM